MHWTFYAAVLCGTFGAVSVALMVIDYARGNR